MASDDVLFLITAGSGNGQAPLGDGWYENALGRFSDGSIQARISGTNDHWPGTSGVGFVAVRRNNSTTAEVFTQAGSLGTYTSTEQSAKAGNNLLFMALGGVFSTERVVLGGKAPYLTNGQIAAGAAQLLAFQSRQAAL